VCGGERVDEVLSGEISGEVVSGRYADFLDQMIGFFGADVAGESGIGDLNSVNDYLVDQGLGAGGSVVGQIPVFYWCGTQARLGGPVTFDITPSDPSRAPTFGWDTTVDNEYDIPELRDDLLERLDTELGLYVPELGAVPPIDKGFTWLKWPTWLWVDDAQDPPVVVDENDTETFRLEMRARVDRVEWSFDGSVIKTCEPADMMQYEASVHHPVNDVPACNVLFEETVSADLQATVYYKVEERSFERLSSNDLYPQVPWQPHPAGLELDLTTVVPDYGVHAVYAVNTPLDKTDEEIAELLRSND